MKVTIEIDAEGRPEAARHLRLIAKNVLLGGMGGVGYNEGDGTGWEYEVDEGQFPHGDYRDTEGNLIHVHADHIVHVTWAGKDAKVESMTDPVPVETWVEAHGSITPVGE